MRYPCRCPLRSCSGTSQRGFGRSPTIPIRYLHFQFPSQSHPAEETGSLPTGAEGREDPGIAAPPLRQSSKEDSRCQLEVTSTSPRGDRCARRLPGPPCVCSQCQQTYVCAVESMQEAASHTWCRAPRGQRGHPTHPACCSALLGCGACTGSSGNRCLGRTAEVTSAGGQCQKGLLVPRSWMRGSEMRFCQQLLHAPGELVLTLQAAPVSSSCLPSPEPQDSPERQPRHLRVVGVQEDTP